jgi:hypothetical protein
MMSLQETLTQLHRLYTQADSGRVNGQIDKVLASISRLERQLVAQGVSDPADVSIRLGTVSHLKGWNRPRFSGAGLAA